MFDKIITIGNTIQFVKWIIEWQEESQPFTEWLVEVAEKDALVNRLERQGVEYQATDVEIPEHLKKYDGIEWSEGRDKALEMINKVPEYMVDSLKVQLSAMDYKTSKHADGDYTEDEWQAIVAERHSLRRKIQELEKILEK